ncbi:hypothetical protein HBH69_163160 [Parastagonospora nodorum]|nr:hypothetical protein HBI74_205820 [Parastagonospora nodorum]KAH5149025.1 hypothetical protein HBH69_163160 [Parastagonospora nodorum]KAH5268608.1 hypothetical protein HBI72_069780 [Parastagonospora nodorum]
MSFSFGFSGDDIEEDPNDVVPQNQQEQGQPTDANGPPPIPARSHDLDEMLSSLPDKISYSTLALTSPLGHTTRLPRRELFDVRLQLMTEDDNSNPHLLSGLDNSDLQTNIYEGGYKTWECSLDLCRYLLDRGPRKDLDDLARVEHVLEMGCGSALPSLLVFQWALRNSWRGYLTLTDYNVDVLRLVSLPNVLLTWIAEMDDAQSHVLFSESGNPLRGAEDHGDVYLTPHILDAFKQHLTNQGIILTFISGSWTPTSSFTSLIPTAPELNTFILGSETIYSPASCTAFTDAITQIMRQVKMGKAVVAAKRVYFGVGGSVDGFRMEVGEKGGVAGEIEFEGLDGEGEGGVRRCLVEVQMV